MKQRAKLKRDLILARSASERSGNNSKSQKGFPGKAKPDHGNARPDHGLDCLIRATFASDRCRPNHFLIVVPGFRLQNLPDRCFENARMIQRTHARPDPHTVSSVH